MELRFIGLAVIATAWIACGFHEVDESPSQSGTLDTATGSGASSAVGGGGVGGGEGAFGGMASTGPGSGGGAPRPGMIGCGADVCASSAQKCCSGKVCLDLAVECPTSGLGTDDLFYEMTCDDSGDCGAGETCCVEPHESVADGFSYVCQTGVCELHPSCTPGALCARDLSCADDPTELTGAKCVDDAASVACGGQLVCEGATPVCCVTASNTCVGYGTCGVMDAAYECDDAADCGTGYACCADAGLVGSTCTGNCGGVTLCAGDADCTGGGTCKPAGGMTPPSFQSCQ